MKITDSDRLDFLENNSLEIFRVPEDKPWIVCDGFGGEWFGTTIRNAIDSAISNKLLSTLKNEK